MKQEEIEALVREIAREVKMAADLKSNYPSSTGDDGEAELDVFCEEWDNKIPSNGRIWRQH